MPDDRVVAITHKNATQHGFPDVHAFHKLCATLINQDQETRAYENTLRKICKYTKLYFVELTYSEGLYLLEMEPEGE